MRQRQGRRLQGPRAVGQARDGGLKALYAAKAAGAASNVSGGTTTDRAGNAKDEAKLCSTWEIDSMKRDRKGSIAYWDRWISFSETYIDEDWDNLSRPPRNPSYRPQFTADLAHTCRKLMLRRYSRGAPVSELNAYFPPMLDAWELSEKLGSDVWSNDEQRWRHDWSINLHFYMDCFWMTGLALCLEIPDEQWRRLVRLMGNAGADQLLDRVITSRDPDRSVGKKLCYPKAYRQLLKVIDAPKEDQAPLLRAYLDAWYPSLYMANKKCADAFLRSPYWYDYGDYNFEGGAYFGRWCIEAAAVVKAFGIDDSLCLDHPNYPGDLIQDNRYKRYPGRTEDSFTNQPPESEGMGWARRLFQKLRG